MSEAVVEQALIEAFADALWMERGLSQNTLVAYQSDLSKLSLWLQRQRGKRLLEAGQKDLLGYLAVLAQQGRQARSSARLLSCMRQFYQYAVRESLLSADPSAQIESPKLPRPLPGTLTEREVELV